MSQSHLKTHVIFYAAAVSIVLGLFRLTSAYGEANLQAPPNISGRYLTTMAPPGCPDSARLAITIQQSGIYLNGALALETADTEMRHTDRFTLNGRWQEQITLSGQTTALAACNSPNASLPTNVTLQGMVQPASKAMLNGRLTFDTAPSWSFTAERQVAPSQNSEH